MKCVLTIAGSDSSGGAGIQADLKTITVHQAYGMSVITAITAQNTMGVTSLMPVPSDMVKSQLQAVLEDIKPDAIKIGMTANKAIIECIADCLSAYEGYIIIDPVMISTSGRRLLEEEALSAFQNELLPLASLITPNIPEAEVLANMTIKSKEDMLIASHCIKHSTGRSVLIKGGHFHTASDLLNHEKLTWFEEDIIDNPNTHGTGCTLSSAIACNLAHGLSLEDSVKQAKAYISKSIKSGLNLGKGKGPLNHMIHL